MPYIAEGSASFSADGKTLTIGENQKVELYGFSEAEVGQVPSKSESENLEWINIPTEISYEEAKELIQS